MKKFGEWLSEQNTLGTDNVESQIDRLYDKAKYAIKIVQMYVRQSAEEKDLLKNISTIAPLNSGVYGLYNSGNNKAIIGQPANSTVRFKFGAPTVANQDSIQKLPLSVIRKYLPEIPPNQIKPSDVIQVNVRRIVSEMGDSMEAIIQIASTIVHEATHEKEYRLSNSPTPNLGETGPQAAEKKFMAWVSANWNNILANIPELNKLSFKNPQQAPHTLHGSVQGYRSQKGSMPN
jgi:hypothetical protein